jgi:hypothetical protein
MVMISSDTRHVMLRIADYLQRMADRTETADGAAKTNSKPTRTE